MKVTLLVIVLSSLCSAVFAADQKKALLPLLPDQITVRGRLTPDQVEARRLTIQAIVRNRHPTARVYTEAQPGGGTRFIVVRPK